MDTSERTASGGGDDGRVGAGGPAYRYGGRIANEIEPAWQSRWSEAGLFDQPNPGEAGFDGTKPRFYVLDMFPYPSGAGLHVGHPEGYTATDIVSRYKRMRGFNVLHPMGYDAFGLPAEQHAVQTGEHPASITEQTIGTFGAQLRRFGFDYDWSREVRTIDPGYYKWTQWIWLRAYRSWFDPHAENGEGTRGAARPISELVDALQRETVMVASDGSVVRVGGGEHDLAGIGGDPIGLRSWGDLSSEERRAVVDDHRLAYLDEQVVNWCPKLGTALANEEVIDGKSERGGHAVVRRPLRQWMFRITAYADRLLDALDGLDWFESTKTMQREWIGRSGGAEVDFELDVPEVVQAAVSADGAPGALRVFTTRPDTLFGATYMVVAPEHALVDALVANPMPETDVLALREYAEAARNRSDLERQESREKTGVFTGAFAVNPANGERMPVWCADYVLAGYGTGAIMAVPAHDQRDMEFALDFGLPVRDVAYPRAELAMAYYARSASAEEAEGDGWRGVLADFVGLVTAEGVGPDGLDGALERVRSRRRGPETPATAMDEALAKGALSALGEGALGGMVGKQRGSVRDQWLEALESLGFERFGDLVEVFEAAGLYRSEGVAMSGSGFAVNSANDEVSLDGLLVAEAKERITAWLEEKGLGSRRVNYKLRDWLFSRQRYWGEPFPVVFDESGDHHGVSDGALPVELPALTDYAPVESDEPAPLLAKAEGWVETTAGEAGVSGDELAAGARVRRETNTMPGWAGSCWYYLRYCDAHNGERFCGVEAERYWMGPTETNPGGGVDLYVGGAEHATLHLLYARFWHKILFDLGFVSTAEPFRKMFHQGMIQSFAYQRSDKSLVPIDEVEERSPGEFVETATGEVVSQIVAKMSKSLRNVVNPDEIIAEYGADAFRLYEMYMGPLDQDKPWSTRDLVGLYRFLQRVWRLVVDEATGEASALVGEGDADEGVEKLLHKTIARVGEGIESLRLNTAIAAMIEFVNAGTKTGVTRSQAARLMKLLSPFAPHIAEELWARMGCEGFVSVSPWPSYDESRLSEETVEVPVQVMGKVRARIEVPADAGEEAMREAALGDERVRALIAGKTVRKVVVVPGRLVNVVAT